MTKRIKYIPINNYEEYDEKALSKTLSKDSPIVRFKRHRVLIDYKNKRKTK